MRKWKARLALSLPVLVLALPALAQGDPNAARGVVVEHCIACHEVPGYKPDRARPSVEAPAFQEIADDAETYTRSRLEDFLRRPHHPMTEYLLSPRDIDNLIAFIEGLRKN
ncbi:MAG: hypothetical protein QF893_07980 [Alphaproteobacteria bacterium]|jgi:mono/diheme cytochrome c family protein|nr:hypothetical protein [Alphaproteobacteria bacterium]